MATMGILHLSDLHFSEGADERSTKHCHSIPLLKAAQKVVEGVQPDYVIVSGDLTNNGDTESLLKAQDWLLRNFGVGGGKVTGLNFPEDRVFVVPGNHDAWNSHASGRYHVRWQRSLLNNYVFVKNRIPQEGCFYRWLEQEDLRVYVAFVDSSYLSEPNQSLEELVDALVQAIDDPSAFRSLVEPAMKDEPPTDPVVYDVRELEELGKLVTITFTVQQRKGLARLLKPYLKKVLNKLSRRPLLQTMAGSTAKALGDDSPGRSFNFYEIQNVEDGVRFKMLRYPWDPDAGKFQSPFEQEHLFQHDRRGA